MPPNRKTHFVGTHSIASLKVSHTLAAKAPDFLLTKSQLPVIDSDLYWNWPADTTDTSTKKLPQVISTDDDADNIFSANHIVANLIQAAQQLSENKQLKAAPVRAGGGVTSSIAQQQKSEEYWFQPFQHVNNIEEIDDRFTCVQNIEAHLLRHAQGAALSRHEDDDCAPPNDTAAAACHSRMNNPESVTSYWDWPAWSEKDHEAWFSVNHVQAGLVRQAESLTWHNNNNNNNNNNSVRTSNATTAAAADYWAF